jgi:hypothetical protein
MGFREIKSKIRYPKGTTERYKRLDALDRLRDGTLYEHIRIPFDNEEEGGEYVKMRNRRPSIIWAGARLLVDQLSGLLWGDEQMPIVRTYYGELPEDEDQTAENTIRHLIEVLNLDAVMDSITEKASSGSCAVILRAVEGATGNGNDPYIEILPGKECKPTFDTRNPNKLLKIEQLYPTTGQALRDGGYGPEIVPDEDLDKDFWFRLEIDTHEEIRYFPMRADLYERLGQIEDGKKIEWKIDPEHSDTHDWPKLPALWIKSPKGNHIDGDCLYGAITDILVEVDYALSQIGRGYRYTADPMLAYKRGELKQGVIPAAYDNVTDRTQRDEKGQVIKSPANVLDIEPGGDAKYLEISGQGLHACGEFVKLLREWGLEIAGGMKSDASTVKGVQSGRALEILYQALILVIKRWRVSLGNAGFIPLIRLLLTGMQSAVITIDGAATIDPNTTMRLIWPQWITPTGSALLDSANAWQVLAGGSPRQPVPILPRTTVTRMAGGNLGMPDVSTLLKTLQAQQEQDDKDEDEAADKEHEREMQLKSAAPKPTIAKPSS